MNMAQKQQIAYLKKIAKVILLLSTILTLAACSKSTFAAQSTSIANQRKAEQAIVIPTTASPQIKELATTLATYLGTISGGQFAVQTGDGKTGLAVGTVMDFPALNLANQFDLTDPTHREDFLLRSHGDGIYLLGATDLAASHAVWELLYRLGYRDFFPGKHWEVVPSNPNLQIAVDVKEHPDFYSRRIWYGFGNWPGQKQLAQDKEDWDARNRMGQSLQINSGHAYDAIIHANQAEFKQHPEYLTKPGGNKFCVSNPGLRQLVINWALSYFEKNPNADSISLEPSDGGGWESDSCPDAKVYSSITDRVVTLANDVAEAVDKKFPDKYVGIYAYYSHAAPPTIKVNPHITVGIATSFGPPFDSIAGAWQKQGAVIGVREYYSVVVSHKDRPGGPPASNFQGISSSIKDQYQKGARFMSAESSDSWGPAGLGYYIAARTLWNTQEEPEAIINDFLDKAFGAAQKPMRNYYQIIDRANKPLMSADLVGRMFRDIDEARKLTKDVGVLSRLDDLALYTHYVELLRKIDDEKSAEDALSFAYRIRDTHMVHSYTLWRDTRDWPVKLSADMAWKVPEGKNPLKNSTPFTQEEIDTFIKNGIAANPLKTFQSVQYSKDLIPATALKLTTPGKIGINGYDRPSYHFYLWVPKAPATISLTVTGGQISIGKNATLTLSAANDPSGKVLSQATAPIDKQPHQVELNTTVSGLQRIDVTSGGYGAGVSWAPGIPVVFASSLDETETISLEQFFQRIHGDAVFDNRVDMYFYVPKGTKIVGGYAHGVGALLDASQKKVLTFTKDKFGNGGYFSVPVAPGQDGKLWEFTSSAGPRYLMTVPPYLTRSADELMLPKEVVEADMGKWR